MQEFLGNKLIFGFVIAVSITLAAHAATEFDVNAITEKEEVFIEAASLDYDYTNNLIIAQGKVEVMKGENIVFADRIEYDQNTNTVIASGNVTAVGADNFAVFSDRVVLSDDLKDGVIDYFRARLSDGSLMAAAQARRINANKIELDKAVYSPCPICREEGGENDSYPQWQLKAERVTMDDIEQTVVYEDAYFEVYGTPIMYTPYFSHPTPNADKKSGFLPPSYATDQNLGLTLLTPYYWNIAPNKDLTFSPMVTSNEGVVFGGDFRHITNYGQYEIEASITRPRELSESFNDQQNGEEWRGHINADGEFDLTNTWDVGFDGELASDDTYLRRYNFSNADLLTSRAYLQHINDRNYSNIQVVGFQGLLEQDNNDTIPIALPYIRNHFETETSTIEGLKPRIWTNLSGFAVERNVGSENRRASLQTGVTIPYITKSGQVLEAQASVRSDYYNQAADALETNETRFIPEVSFGWSLPLASEFVENQLIIQPEVKLIVSPNEDYNTGIINEDSQDVEFSDLNIFKNNRFRGLDLVESGTRAHYGLRGGYYANDYDVNFTVGQSYSFEEPQNLPLNSGLNDNLSDIVGRVSLAAYKNFDLSYRFRVDKGGLKFRRNELDANLDFDRLQLNLNYLFLDYDFLNPTDNREEVSGNIKFYVADEWAVLAGGRRNLDADQSIDASVGIGYEGECASITTFVRRDFISDRDFEAGTSYGIQVGLKNLGEF
jgi:LPS-assembly protein